jgi:predicted NACHT family NTPase
VRFPQIFRNSTYKEGLDILLKKWDNTRSTKREQVYKNLSIQRKEDLLSQIALKTFEWGEYYSNQKQLKQYIADYICNLPNAQNNSEALQLDSEAVLKSIQAQHGILVELTEGIYSFSILAFHQYLTAKAIIDSSNPQILETAFQNLVSHINETRWREVILLAASMMRNADYLLSLIKEQTNVIASNQVLQQFLAWSNQNSNKVKAPYKPLALQNFYLEFVLELDFDFASSLDNKLAYDLGYNLACVHNYTHVLQSFQFSEQQKQALKQYYNANKLLMDCLDNARYVTRRVREEIENTLLVQSEIL